MPSHRIRKPESLVTLTCETCHAPYVREERSLRRAIRLGLGLFCGQPCRYPDGRGDPSDRLWAHVVKTDTCWLRTRQVTPQGYSRLAFKRDGSNGQMAAHVLAWELASGQRAPRGMHVCHVCDVKNCVRNDEVGTYEVNGKTVVRYGHLFLGTSADNAADRMWKGRSAIGAANGSRLHPERLRRGSATSNSVLTEEGVRIIRAAAARGVLNTVIAQVFDIATGTVKSILQGATWAHVPTHTEPPAAPGPPFGDG